MSVQWIACPECTFKLPYAILGKQGSFRTGGEFATLCRHRAGFARPAQLVLHHQRHHGLPATARKDPYGRRIGHDRPDRPAITDGFRQGRCRLRSYAQQELAVSVGEHLRVRVMDEDQRPRTAPDRTRVVAEERQLG